MGKVALSPLAADDLKNIRGYIADELQNPTAVENVLNLIMSRLRRLETFLNLGAPLSSIVDTETDYRFLVCGNYIAFYYIFGETARVVRILYGRMDFMKILFGSE